MIRIYKYDLFGNDIKLDLKEDNPFRYCGEYFDKETGEIYLRARYYQPENGRFMTRDTYTGEENDPLSLHLYTYCAGNPINYVDPTGHVIETLLDAGSIIWSTIDLIREPSWKNAGYLAWDVGATVVPFVPGSYVAKGAKAGSKILKGSQKTKKIRKAIKLIKKSPFSKLSKSGHIDSRKVRFSQDNIGKTFGKDGPLLSATIESVKMDSFPAIRIFEVNGQIFTLDNRRLYVAK